MRRCGRSYSRTHSSRWHIKSFRHLRQLKDRWRGFEIAVENDSVLVRRRGSLESMANRSEITKLLEMPGRGLWIHTSDRRKRIWAPSSLSGYEELKARLAMWATIERRGSA